MTPIISGKRAACFETAAKTRGPLGWFAMADMYRRAGPVMCIASPPRSRPCSPRAAAPARPATSLRKPWRRIGIGISAAALLSTMTFPVLAEVAKPPERLDEIQVTAERLGLLGTASTASEGIVVNEELALTPAYRVGQLLETIPGLQVTSHSGEGKANQYLLRGYNLDHGTDLAVFVDGMPINEPTHAHGQGYTDLNFLIPELVTNISYTKGTYYADEGDFASVGSVHIDYLDSIPDELSLTAGNFNYQRVFAAGSAQLNRSNVLGAVELQHYDGP